MSKGDELGMFKTVEQHDDLLNKNILPRLEEVEKMQKEFKSSQEEIKSEVKSIKTEVTAVRSAQTSMELTVLKDGAQTRDLLNRFVDHYFNADGKAFKSKDKVTLTKLGSKEKIWLAIISIFTGSAVTAAASVAIAYINK